MKIRWTRRTRFFTGVWSVVAAAVVIILVFTFVGMPGGSKLFGTAAGDLPKVIQFSGQEGTHKVYRATTGWLDVSDFLLTYQVEAPLGLDRIEVWQLREGTAVWNVPMVYDNPGFSATIWAHPDRVFWLYENIDYAVYQYAIRVYDKQGNWTDNKNELSGGQPQVFEHLKWDNRKPTRVTAFSGQGKKHTIYFTSEGKASPTDDFFINFTVESPEVIDRIEVWEHKEGTIGWGMTNSVTDPGASGSIWAHPDQLQRWDDISYAVYWYAIRVYDKAGRGTNNKNDLSGGQPQVFEDLKWDNRY